jgi:hypothetical protein
MKRENRGQTPTGKSGSDPDFLGWGLTPIFLLTLLVAFPAWGQQCRVIDPELQRAYRGPCVNGLAEGEGEASGIAEYRGGFRAGRKHGKGVKSWQNGDRYEGEFHEDQKHGAGVYTWGRGPWAGERYEGQYVQDKREGFGVYRWPSGDVYRGPWKEDAFAGPPTEMMIARAKFIEEARAAVAKPGQKVCREVAVGIGERDWLRGTVLDTSAEHVAVRIEDPGRQSHFVGTQEAKPGAVVWDEPTRWTPCY